ncbi:rho guanine nucleotide exchange factor 10-like isoform X2 [Lethenteron reissneri]|uniref:rho guanine nucleotide exchange factor 10-like isoform X2 n=1 Tax=Lethenteron reissneri TaxID=7753 RepID=UPI002AB6AE72|nr:rho guanine nucleotide exchange factor 10-like isoform X2 [Lethenteron reissneri]
MEEDCEGVVPPPKPPPADYPPHPSPPTDTDPPPPPPPDYGSGPRGFPTADPTKTPVAAQTGDPTQEDADDEEEEEEEGEMFDFEEGDNVETRTPHPALTTTAALTTTTLTTTTLTTTTTTATTATTATPTATTATPTTATLTPPTTLTPTNALSPTGPRLPTTPLETAGGVPGGGDPTPPLRDDSVRLPVERERSGYDEDVSGTQGAARDELHEVIYDDVPIEAQSPTLSGVDRIYDAVCPEGRGGGARGSGSEGWSSSEFESYSDEDGAEGEGRPPRTGGALALPANLRRSRRPVQELMRAARDGTKDGLEKLEKTKAAVLKRGRFFMQRTSLISQSQGRPAASDEDDVQLDVKMETLTLGPAPPGLSQQQLKRRYILGSIVESEKSYVQTLKDIHTRYELPLLEGESRLLSERKVRAVFSGVRDLLQCHCMFHIALGSRVAQWELTDSIGDVFVASFSRSMVQDVYSEYVSNFSTAMEIVRKASATRPAFLEFIKSCQEASADRHSLQALMMKPVQRFPQFILLLQDMLRNTPRGHPDRLPLQMALTELETLAGRLNERQRLAGRRNELRAVASAIHDRQLAKLLGTGERYLVRVDDVTESVVGERRLILKTRPRRLFMLNDTIVCAGLNPRIPYDGNGMVPAGPRFTLKWSVPLRQVQVSGGECDEEGGADKGAPPPQLSVDPKGSHLYSGPARLYVELQELHSDFQLMTQISQLTGQLHGTYATLTPALVQECAASVQRLIQQKEAQIRGSDRCRVQLQLQGKPDKHGRPVSFVSVFHFSSPGARASWLRDLKTATLSLEDANQWGWFSAEDEDRPQAPHRCPLLLSHMPVFEAGTQDLRPECAVYNPVPSSSVGEGWRHQLSLGQGTIWIGSGDASMGQLSVLSLGNAEPRVTEGFSVEARVLCAEFVPAPPDPPTPGGSPPDPSTWLALDDGSVCAYRSSPACKKVRLWREPTPGGSPAGSLRYAHGRVYAGLRDGTFAVYTRGADAAWAVHATFSLGSLPVPALLPVGEALWAACGNHIAVRTAGGEAATPAGFEAHPEAEVHVSQVALAGVGVWVSFSRGTSLRLFHTETLEQLQDVNIATPVNRMTPGGAAQWPLVVTCLASCPGLLWVGTSLGLIVALPLPRLEGLPKLTGRGMVAYHAHSGAVTFLAVAMGTCANEAGVEAAGTPSATAPPGFEVHHPPDSPPPCGPESPFALDDGTALGPEGAGGGEGAERGGDVGGGRRGARAAGVSTALVVSGGLGYRSLPRPGGKAPQGPPHSQHSLMLWYYPV